MGDMFLFQIQGLMKTPKEWKERIFKSKSSKGRNPFWCFNMAVMQHVRELKWKREVKNCGFKY